VAEPEVAAVAAVAAAAAALQPALGASPHQRDHASVDLMVITRLVKAALSITRAPVESTGPIARVQRLTLVDFMGNLCGARPEPTLATVITRVQRVRNVYR
jgi:hypothetical protein